MTNLTPYILFDGTCKEAMEFYRSCLGGELHIRLVADSAFKSEMPPSLHGRVLNAYLKGDNLNVSASDWLSPEPYPKRDNTVCLFLNGGPLAELKTFFDALSEGTEVISPLGDVPFGTYGALTDKFGVRWMFQSSERA